MGWEQYHNHGEHVLILNQPLNQWNVHNVADMSGMLRSACVFNQSIASWEVRKVTNMSFMFWGASSFNQRIGMWRVDDVVAGMFNDAQSFQSTFDLLECA